jgi:2-(1,2-epoxy-1,2-dihydrophenyl)acetyl-CoA isomerase
MTEPIRLKKEGGVVEVLLNRPEAFNAFDLDTIEVLEKCLIRLAMDDSVSALVISGEGKAFCAGGDLKWALDFPSGPAAAFHE